MEISYNNSEVFSPLFLNIVRSIYNRTNNPVAEYIINNGKSYFSDKYRYISLGLQDSDPSEFNTTESEALIEKLSYTPKEKSLFLSDDKIFINRKYRQFGDIGAILKRLIEFDSFLVKGEKVEDPAGREFVYDKNKDFYYNEKNGEIIFFENDEFISRKTFERRKTKFPDSEYEKLVNELKAEAHSKLEFEIVTGSDISKFYLEKNYSHKYGCGGNLFGSCMRGENQQKQINFYDKNENFKMLVIKDNKSIVARALLSKTNMGWYLDRRYASNDSLIQNMVKYAREQHWHYKTKNSFDDVDQITCFNFKTGKYETLRPVPLFVKTNIVEFGQKFPYMDTLDKLIRGKDGKFFVSNVYCGDISNIYALKSTSGNGDECTNSDNRNKSNCFLFNGFYVKNSITTYKDFKGNDLPDQMCSDKKNPENNFNMYCEEDFIEFQEKNKKDK